MDPETTWQELNELLRLAADATSLEDARAYAEEAQAKADDLQGWLDRGGFLWTGRADR